MRVAVALGVGLTSVAFGDTWRVGDADQPWFLHAVSRDLDRSTERFRPNYVLGGPHAVEIVVDDDGDGAIDEDPVELVDDDGDGFYNEDPADGIDNDRDGRVDEDGPDPQIDNDGDGFLNEDGRMTGGVIYHARYRGVFPYSTRQVPGEYGDDDLDAAVNEDPINGLDDDGDGLIDEDDRAAAMPRSGTWVRQAFSYAQDASADLQFTWDSANRRYLAVTQDGDTVIAALGQVRWQPTDWLRPIRLDSARNLARLTDDRFLSGEFGTDDPFTTTGYGGVYAAASVREGDVGFAASLDGNISTARLLASHKRYFTMELRGLFLVDRLRFLPRPEFPDRAIDDFRVTYAGDEPGHTFAVESRGVVEWKLNPRSFLIPEQKDQKLPAVKDFRLDGGELGPPRNARLVILEPQLTDLTFSQGLMETAWELAEVELYGRGYAQDAAYVTEIIDVGAASPRYQRYHDPDQSGRPMPYEDLVEANPAAARRQFDPTVPGRSVSLGRVRWQGELEGSGAGVSVRVRTGASLDPYVYQREVAPGIRSEFAETGERLTAEEFLAMRSRERAPVAVLPYNHLHRGEDGALVGWTPWSAPIDFATGHAGPGGGVDIPQPGLTRYVQFRLDFTGGPAAGAALDFIEFNFGAPYVSGGILAELEPETASLGDPTAFRYVLRPVFASTGDAGFNRLDIAVPTADARVDSVVVDGERWRSVASTFTGPAWGIADETLMAEAGERLDTLVVSGEGAFASAVYTDVDGQRVLGLKTRTLTAEDFRYGDERLEVYFHAPVYNLYTEFRSWVWNDGRSEGLRQATEPGNASEEMGANGIGVLVQEVDGPALQVAVFPNPFTPNGDGVNDESVISVELYLLTGTSDLEVGLYDLGGSLVRRIVRRAAASGRHTVLWDGRRDDGATVPPGIYLCSVSALGDVGKREWTGLVAVAY